jgi:hypothetical protein
MGRATFTKGFQKQAVSEGRRAVMVKIDTESVSIQAEISVRKDQAGKLWRFIQTLATCDSPTAAYAAAFVEQ